MCAHAILPDVKPQKCTPRLIAFYSVTEATFGLMQGQSPLCPPCPAPLVTVFQSRAIFVEHHALISRSEDTSVRGALGAGLVHPMPGKERSQGGKRSPLGRAGRGGTEGGLFQETRVAPGFAWSASNGERLRCGQEGGRSDAVEALGNITLERVLRLQSDRVAEGSHGVPAGASRATALGMRR